MRKFLVLFFVFNLICSVSHAAPPQRIFPYLDGTTIRSDEVEGNEDEIFGYLQVGVDTIRTDGVDAITEIKSTIKSGSDATLITGTATAGMCGQFDSNGDLVSAGAACGTGSGSGSSTPPTYDAILDPVNNAGITFGAFTNIWTSSVGNATFFTIDGSGTDFVVQGDGDVIASSFTGSLTGNATTATALAANGGNCSAGSYPLGVDASGAVENCTAAGSGTATRYDEILDPTNNGGISFGAFTNTWTATNADTAFFRIDATADFVVRADGNVGIGQTDPSTALVVTGTATATTSVSTPLLDLSGTGTINGLDAIDSTTETTLEGALDLAGDVSATGLGNTIIGNKAIRLDEVADPGTQAGFNFGTITNTWTSTGTTSAFFTINGSGEDITILGNGNLGIGDASPAASLVVGNGDDFQVTSAGVISAAAGITSSGTITFSGLANCNLDTDGSGVVTCGTDASGGAADVRLDQILDPGTHSGIAFGAFSNSWTFAGGTNVWTSTLSKDSDFFTIQSSNIDFTNANLELPKGTATTASDCDVSGDSGRIFIDTDATSGQQVYVCEGTAGWKLQGDGGGAGTESLFLPVTTAKLTGGFVVRTPTSGDATTQGAELTGGEGNWRMLFDATTDEGAVWQFRLPDYWTGHSEVNIFYTMASATASEVEFEVDVMCITDGDSADIATASFVGVAVGSATVPGTAGYPDEVSVTVTDDSCAAGDMIFVYLSTDADDATNDDATGDREVVGVEYEFTK